MSLIKSRLIKNCLLDGNEYMKNHMLKQASSACIKSWTWLVGNERSNCEPFITEDDTYKCRLRYREWGKEALGRAGSQLSPTVSIIQTERAGKESVSPRFLPLSPLSCLSLKPLPFTSPAPTSLDPSLWLVKIYSIEGLCHDDAFVTWRQGRGCWSLPLCSV